VLAQEGSMIVEMGVCLEISEPDAVIFLEKMLVARAVAHAHEPGSGDELSPCLRCSGLTVAPGKAASEPGTVAVRTWLHRVRVICGARLVNARSEKRETSNDGPVSIIQSSCLDV